MDILSEGDCPDLLVSIHIPKTGGTTLGGVLKEKFGDGLFLDYPYLEGIRERKRPIDAVHVHFFLLKYFNLQHLVPNPRVFTFLREPLDRVLSNFFYWLNLPELQDSDLYRKYFLDMKPDMETFLFAPEMTNICSKYLMPIDRPDHFWFVGFQKTFTEDIARLQKMFDMPIREQSFLNQQRKSKPSVEMPLKLIDRFYELNWQDKAFYDLMVSDRRRHMSTRSITVPAMPAQRQGDPNNGLESRMQNLKG